jgi:hypothetical protein
VHDGRVDEHVVEVQRILTVARRSIALKDMRRSIGMDQAAVMRRFRMAITLII